MKNLLFISLLLLCGIASAQTKNNLSAEEKALIGKWSFNNPNHILKKKVKGSENVLTIELKEDKTFNSLDYYSKKGIELLTEKEGGTWKVKGNEISLAFSRNARTIKYYYKFDKGNLLFSTKKDDFKYHSLFKKANAK